MGVFPEKRIEFRRIKLNTLYTKVLLYAYPNIESLVDQIDELVEKKAITSMDATSPCLDICNSIISLIKEKDLYLDLLVTLDGILENLTEYEKMCIEYKYFLVRDKDKFVGFDYTSKQYFRHQNKILEKIRKRLDKKGYDDNFFREKYLPIKFFKALLRGVKEKEKHVNKNKKSKECLLDKKACA